MPVATDAIVVEHAGARWFFLAAARALGDDVPTMFLEDYDVDLPRVRHVWTNTPKPPLEASRTSGMKAAQNGVPSVSTRDGWWLEGAIEGLTKWSFGEAAASDEWDAADLLRALAERVVPSFQDRERWSSIARQTIAINASYFNTHRMLQHYVVHAYR